MCTPRPNVTCRPEVKVCITMTKDVRDEGGDDVGEKSEDDVSKKGEDDLKEEGEDHLDGTMNPLISTSAPAAPVKRNEFTTRKTAAHAMMDAALFMANISQLRMLMADDSATTRFFIPLLCLVLFSILCQILFALLILVIWNRKATQQDSNRPSESTGYRVGDMSSSPNSPMIHRHPHHHHPSPACDSFDDYHHHKNNNSYNGVPSSPPPLSTSHQYDGAGAVAKPPASVLLNGRMTSIDMDDVNPCAAVTRQRTGSDGDAAAAASVTKFDVTTQRLHMFTLLLVFLITVANMFITGLGFDPAGVHKVVMPGGDAAQDPLNVAAAGNVDAGGE